MNCLFEFRNKYNIKNFSTDLPSEYKLAYNLNINQEYGLIICEFALFFYTFFKIRNLSPPKDYKIIIEEKLLI